MDTSYTFTHNGAQITLARQTNRHALLIDRVSIVLREAGNETPEGLTDAAYRRLFAETLVQTQAMVGDLGLELVSPAAPAEEIQAAYQRFLDADRALGDAFYAALKAVNAPPGPRETLPPDELDEAERKNLRRAGRTGAPNAAPSSDALPTVTATSQD
jgi:hypothetical protein